MKKVYELKEVKAKKLLGINGNRFKMVQAWQVILNGKMIFQSFSKENAEKRLKLMQEKYS